MEPKLHHVPCKSADKGAPAWFYGMFKTKDGGFGFNVMSVEDVRAHAKKYSQSYNSSYSPWSTNFEEMAKKTVLKRALKYAPLKTEFQRAMTTDGTIKTELSEDMFTVPTEYVETESVENGTVDSETGEVKA